MNETDLKLIARKFPLSQSTLARNAKVGSIPSSAKPECPVRHDTVGSPPRKEKNPTRYLVSIVSYRYVLLDPDNLCPKYFVDAIRYAEIIPDDSARHIEYRVRQEQIPKSERPRTEILIELLPSLT